MLLLFLLSHPLPPREAVDVKVKKAKATAKWMIKRMIKIKKVMSVKGRKVAALVALAAEIDEEVEVAAIELKVTGAAKAARDEEVEVEIIEPNIVRALIKEIGGEVEVDAIEPKVTEALRREIDEEVEAEATGPKVVVGVRTAETGEGVEVEIIEEEPENKIAYPEIYGSYDFFLKEIRARLSFKSV